MMNLVIGIGVVLVLVILFMIFRVTTLVSVVKGDEGKVGSRNKINALLFPVFCVTSLVLFFWYSYAHYDRYVTGGFRARQNHRFIVLDYHGDLRDCLCAHFNCDVLVYLQVPV